MTAIEIKGSGFINLKDLSIFLVEEIQQKTWHLSDFILNGLYIVGSRIQHRHREGSDLDVVVMYEGSVSECTLHDILNAEPSFYDEIQIDFISTYGTDFEPSDRPYIQCIIEEDER